MTKEEEKKELISILEELEKKIASIKEEIKKMQKKEKQKEIKPEPKKEEIVFLEEEEEDSFQEEVNFFLENYRLLRIHFQEEELNYVLPSKKHPNYQNILLRCYYSSIKEIEDLNELKKDSSEEEIKEIEDLIQQEERKKNLLKGKIEKKQEEKEEEIDEKNEIILVPTISGNIRIVDELEHIPMEYYEGFKELINSIVDGTFKNVKVLTNDRYLMGICEVKLFKIRVVFSRLSKNKYALITAFMKKSDTDKLYLESLKSKVFDFHKMESTLKELIKKEDFLKQNEESVKEMYSLLEKKEKNKVLRKEDCCDY